MKYILLTALVVSCIGMTACGTTQQADPTARSGSELALFVEKYFNAYYAFNPSEATSAGFHQYDKQLEDRSASRIRSRRQWRPTAFPAVPAAG